MSIEKNETQNTFTVEVTLNRLTNHVQLPFDCYKEIILETVTFLYLRKNLNEVLSHQNVFIRIPIPFILMFSKISEDGNP